MQESDKKKLKNNILQFVFGCVLLSFSFLYLHTHTAEARSILSGFDTLFEKIAVSWEKISSPENAELLEKKFKLEKYLEDILWTIEERNCIDTKTLEKIHEIQSHLRILNTKELSMYLDDYFQKIYIIDDIVKQSCK